MKSPAFQFYVDDFLGGTMHFTDAEVGLYIRLLCVQWSTGKIPCDNHELSSYGKGDTNVDRVKAKFEVGKDGFLRNKRLEFERQKQESYRKSRSDNGKQGGRPKKPYGLHKVLKAKAQKSSPSPSPSTEPSYVGSEHKAFIQGWSENFKAAFGFDYQFVPRDAKAVQGLLRTGILRIDLLEIAKSAWKRGNDDKFASACKKTSTIWEFKDSFNQVQVELKRKYENNGASGSKGFDRNKGTLNAGHAERYDLKKIQEERALRDAAKPTVGENA